MLPTFLKYIRLFPYMSCSKFSPGIIPFIFLLLFALALFHPCQLLHLSTAPIKKYSSSIISFLRKTPPIRTFILTSTFCTLNLELSIPKQSYTVPWTVAGVITNTLSVLINSGHRLQIPYKRLVMFFAPFLFFYPGKIFALFALLTSIRLDDILNHPSPEGRATGRKRT